MKKQKLRQQLFEMLVFIVVTGFSMLMMIAVYTSACGHPVSVLKMMGL